MTALLRAFLGLVFLAAAGCADVRAQDDQPVEPPPPVDLDQPSRIGRQRIESLLGAGKAFALVIGVRDFGDRHWSTLAGVDEEAAAVSNALKAQGFEVSEITGKRTAKADIKMALDQFAEVQGRNPDNRLVIYIASHGLAVTEATKRGRESIGYVIARDTPRPESTDFSPHALSVDEISSALVRSRSRHILLAFNTCFSGALVPGTREGAPVTRVAARPAGPPLAPEVADWVETLLSEPARLVMTAGNGGQPVPDVDNPFGRAFVEGLYGAADRDGDGLILGSELAQFVRAKVALETRRNGRPNDPVFAVLSEPAARGSGPSTGDFVFRSPRGVAGVEARLDTKALERRRGTLAGGQHTDCLDCPVMVELKGFEAGKDSAGVALSRDEITIAEWQQCYRQGICRSYRQGAGDQPVQGVSWLDSLDFVSWLNAEGAPDRLCRRYRLPTRTEWLFGARAGAASRFAWGDGVLADRANCRGCGSQWDGAGVAPVGRFPANALGLRDMIGNVWEWVDTPDAPCRAGDLATGRCKPGVVMGGGFSTRIDAIDLRREALSGTMARGLRGWPTVGLRVACDLDADAVSRRE